MPKTLADKIKELPRKPGVYIFKDAKGLFLYVGKAVKLKNRVKSYFAEGRPLQEDGPLSRIQQMVSQIADLDYVVTDNETESLVLENNLIKQTQPKYNVKLRDDKNYLFIKINVRDEIPTIGFERKPTDKHARYFGPYTSSQAIKDTLRLVRKIFPYCANKKVGNRPCFYYHIGKCPGVCVGKISLEEYRSNYVKKIIDFLQGRRSEILKELQAQMRKSAARKQYEKAAKIRDQIFALNRVLERQKLVYPRKIDQDVFSLYQDGMAAINLFIIREGKLVRKENFILENTKGISPLEIFSEFLPRYYLEASDWPKEILLPPNVILNEVKDLMRFFADAQNDKKRIPRIIVPTRGPKLQLIKLGTENAKQYLESQSGKKLLEEARLLSALKELQQVLDLPKLPGRIEAYDVSNIQGKNPTGSMVVFDYGRPKKEDYRRFKINRKQTPDDYAMMREVLERRLSWIMDHGSWIKPDLILIDGGKGQLNAALSVLRQIPDSKFQIPIIGLAKRLEEIFLPGKPKSLILNPNSIALFLLQRIRDEAHRFALSYHRKLRNKSMAQSVLDQIPGIGPLNKRKLLETFGSIGKIRNTSLTELANIVGRQLAEKIKASL